MTGLEGMDPKSRREYTGAYGPFGAGDYQIGQQLRAPGVIGEVIWSFHSCDGRGLVYVVDDASGFPVEVRASEVQA
jgi:hypothetical protein